MESKLVMQHLVGKTYQEVVDSLRVESHDGDCCGWSDHEVTDLVKEIEGSQSAKLKDVVLIDYSEDEGSRVVVNFIFDIGGGDGVILGYELSAGSGSGWAYGACCTLFHGDEEIASASF